MTAMWKAEFAQRPLVAGSLIGLRSFAVDGGNRFVRRPWPVVMRPCSPGCRVCAAYERMANAELQQRGGYGSQPTPTKN